MSAIPPCVLFEDEDLLVIRKPPGVNTHSPAPFHNEGIYDWLRSREKRWASLAIIHRLDKETSGILLFSKTPRANRSLTEQFAGRQVEKSYVFWTGNAPRWSKRVEKSRIARFGEKYQSGSRGDDAETHFTVRGQAGRFWEIEARPLTGRTHQVRVHASDAGVPILGDELYGGAEHHRLCLHAERIAIRHPSTDEKIRFEVAAKFETPSRLEMAECLFAMEETDCYRLVHGAGDDWPGWRVDRLGHFLLSQSEEGLTGARKEWLRRIAGWAASDGAYELRWVNKERGKKECSPEPVRAFGKEAPDDFLIRENGLRYWARIGAAAGLFLDQRENRRRVLDGYMNGDWSLYGEALGQKPRVLNLFAYTCGFSVCAARAGCQVTSVDLSKSHLEQGKRNLLANGCVPEEHDFIFGDVFHWIKRFIKRDALYDVVLVDPPSFSRSKVSGVFRVERHLPQLTSQASRLVRPGGALFISTNLTTMRPEQFLMHVREGLGLAGRAIEQEYYAPQPMDFPISRREPAYLKTVWLKLA